MKALFGRITALALPLLCGASELMAQCSVCTKTAEQLGPDAAKGLNAGILYLAAVPFAVVGFIGYRWWKQNHEEED